MVGETWCTFKDLLVTLPRSVSLNLLGLTERSKEVLVNPNQRHVCIEKMISKDWFLLDLNRTPDASDYQGIQILRHQKLCIFETFHIADALICEWPNLTSSWRSTDIF